MIVATKSIEALEKLLSYELSSYSNLPAYLGLLYLTLKENSAIYRKNFKIIFDFNELQYLETSDTDSYTQTMKTLNFENYLELSLLDAKWFFTKEESNKYYQENKKKPKEHPYRKNKELLALIDSITSLYIDSKGTLPTTYVLPYLALFQDNTLTYFPEEYKTTNKILYPYYNFGNHPKIFKWDKYNGSLKFKPINRIGRFISLYPRSYLSELYQPRIEKYLIFKKE